MNRNRRYMSKASTNNNNNNNNNNNDSIKNNGYTPPSLIKIKKRYGSQDFYSRKHTIFLRICTKQFKM